VSTSNVLDYLKAGAAVVGVGNNIVDQKALAAGDRAQVIRHARQFLELASNAGQ
jgi:2-keto-3-deoxy-6-phosphogluconate aldolase